MTQGGYKSLPGFHGEFTGELELKFRDPTKVLFPLPSEATVKGTPLGVTRPLPST